MILAAKYTRMEQDDAKAIREIMAAMVAEACSTADKIKELESELPFLKGSDVSAPIAKQLEISC